MQKHIQKLLSVILVLAMVAGYFPAVFSANATGAATNVESTSDMLENASFVSGNVSWNGNSIYTYDNKSTVTNGADSLSSWRFSRTTAEGYTYPTMLIDFGKSYDLTNQDLVFDIKADPAEELTSYNVGITLYDSNAAQISQIYYLYYTGNGWNTMTMENGALQAYLLPGKSLSDVKYINMQFTLPAGGAQNIYVDNMHLVQRPAATDAMDSAADMLADAKVVSNVANDNTLFYEHNCTAVSYGAESNTSHKFSATAGESETLTVKYDLGKSYNLTGKNIVLDMLSINAGNGFTINLYNSSNQLVSYTNSYTTIGQWASVTPAILNGLQSGKNLSDVRYISIGAKFDTNTSRSDRAFYVDNMRIVDIDVHYTPLQNKNIVFMGDSITAAGGYKGWSGELLEHYGINRYNLGVGGTSYSNVANRTTIYTQLDRIPAGVDVDFFVLNGGVNDIWSAIDDLGTVSDIPVSSATVDDFNFETTASGMEKVFCYLRTNYPNAKIAFIINYICYAGDFDGVRFRDEFVPLAKAICDKWGVPYLDLVNNTEFNAKFSAIYNVHTYDGVHGNDYGYELVMRELAPWLISMCEGTEQTEQDTDRLAYATNSYSASDWTGAGSLSYTNACTDTYGSDSIRSWKFSATAGQNTNPSMLLYLQELNAFDLTGKALALDVKFEGGAQKLGVQFYDGNWKELTSTVWVNGNGTSGWQTITMDAALFEADLKSGMSLQDINFLNFTFNFADNAGNVQNVYIDNVRIVTSATEATEAASDLLYGASYVDGYFTTPGFGYDLQNTAYVNGTDSKYSLRFYAADDKTAWTNATFKLPHSIDLTKNTLKFDVLQKEHRSMNVDLYDSNFELVTSDSFILRNEGWQTFEINAMFGLAKGRTTADLSDIAYIKFSFSFETAATGRTVIIDNLITYENEQYGTMISGMHGLYLGDSISEAISYKGWAGELAEHYGVTGLNVSASGAVLTNNLTHNLHQQLDRVPDGADFDFVLLNGGVNDVWRSLPLGEVSPEGTTEFNVDTAIGALEDLFSRLKAEYPNSEICYILNFVCVQAGYPSDTFRNEFAPLARQACEKWDIHCLDLVDNSEFNAEFDASAGVHTYDGVHPNTEGYVVLTKYIAQWLEEIMCVDAKVRYQQLSLSDDLTMRFDLLVSDAYKETATVTVAVDGNVVTEVLFHELPNGTSGCKRVEVALAAAQMTDDIVVTISNDGAALLEETYSILKYARYLLDGDYNSKTKNLANAVLNYGANAQLYFGHNTDNLANAGLTAPEAVEIPEINTENMISGSVPGINYYGASLVYVSKVAVRFYFYVNGDISNYTFSAGNAPVYKDGKYYVEVSGINPQDYAKDIVLTVSDGENEMTVTYSPMYYLGRMYGKTENQSLKNLLVAMYQYHLAAVKYVAEDVVRGNYFAAGEDTIIDVVNTDKLSSISFDYKITDGEKFNIALLCDWSNYYGYYAFNAKGSIGTYNGVTTTRLDDDYVRVTMNIAELTALGNTPNGIIDFLFIRGGEWSDANGYIDNVQFSNIVEEPENPGAEFDGAKFTAYTDTIIAMDNEKAVTQVSFDYKIDSGEYFHLALLPDWSNYFGYFNFNAQGAAYTYEGVTTEKLDNGYIHVIMDMSALTQISGMPSDVLKILFVRGSGDWSNANGEITNIFLSYAAENAPRGEAIEEGINKTIILENTEKLESLSFEYKITSGTRFNIALMADWSNFYGNYAFGIDGAVEQNDGITTEVLEDGYIRVTFDIKALTKLNGTPSAVIDFLFIRGDWTDANGYIDNIQFSTDNDEPEETEPEDVPPLGDETLSGDWTNIDVDSGMSNANYAISGLHTAPGSTRALKITTKPGDIGNVYLNTEAAVMNGDLEKLPDFSSGKITAWFYFGNQRPMAFLRGIDANWNVGVTGIFTFTDMGDGWYYGELAASELGFEVRKSNTKIEEIIRIDVEIPGDYTVYVDNLKWESFSVTEETEKEYDLLSVCTVVSGASTITAENSTDMASGLNSLYSKKFTAKAGVTEKKSIRYELPKAYDMTHQALSVDVHRYDFDTSYGTMMVSLQDSNGNTVVDALVDNIYWLNWNHIEVDLYKYLEDGKSLSDVKYITFTFYFDRHTEYDREIYLDNLSITPYETYESVLNGTSALYIGDSISISKPFKGWAGLLEERYGVERTNVSVGGTTFSNIGYQIKEQLKNVPEDAEYDYIILDGGINDLYLSCPDLGKVSDLPVTASPSKFDDSTAIGAFEQLLSLLKRRFPDAKIGYVITYQRTDRWLNEFVPEVKKACEKWGVSCLSLPETYEFIQLFNNNTGAHTTDTVHANVAGYELVMEHLPQWMETIPEPEPIEGFEPDVGKEVFDGGTFAAGENTTFALDNRNSVSKLSFDYKIDSGETFSIALLSDWSNYFGYFKFGANGSSMNYPGITTEKIDDGYIRVFVDVSAVTNMAGTPSDLVTILFVRGDSTTANGSITNICINSAVDGEPRGEAIIAGEHKNITLNNKDALSKVSFEYKLVDEGRFNIALMPDWSNFFGYFKFDANGASETYAGVTTTVLSDGYIRVSFDMDALTKVSGAPSNVIDFLYIRGDWSDANGYIDNVQFVKATAEPEEPTSDIAAATKTLYVPQGEEFVILNLSDLQLHDGQDPQYTYDVISQLVEKTQPDLITVLGDTAQDNKNYPATTNFANLVKHIDSFDIPWAPIFGNHDHDTYSPGYDSPKGVSDEWIMAQFASAENCIFMEGPENVDGCGNYIVHIKEQGTDKLIRALYFFDSLLVGVNDSHVQFYRDAVAYTTSLNNGETLESIVFIHIPLPQYATVYSQQLEVDFADTVGTVGRPATDLASGTTEFFTAIKELGSTLNVIAGHDHENAYYITYEGVKLIYNMKSSDGDDYHNVANTGGGVFTIGQTTEFRYERASVVQEVTEPTAYIMPLLANWQNSGKAVSFTFSATDTVTTGNTFSFVLCGSNTRRTTLELKDRHGGWNRLTNAVTVDIASLTASLGTVVANDDGTYTYYLKLSDAPLNKAASEAAYGDETLKLIYFNSVNHSVKIGDICYVDGNSVPEPPRGETIIAGENKTVLLNNKKVLSQISFEYKLVNGGQFNIGLLPDWSNFFGYYAFNASGNAYAYDGVTTEKLSDGYIRVTFDMDALTKVSGAPTTAIDFLFLRGDWSDASGYIDNVQFVVAGEEPAEPTPVYDIVAGNTIDLENATNISTLSFDYKIDSGERFNIALLCDWSNFYGYYKFTANGAAEAYSGVSYTVLNNGYIRVTFDVAALTKVSGNPTNTLMHLLLHGSWTDATGSITNIQYS